MIDASPYAPRTWAPDERPTLPGGPSFPAHSGPRRAAYGVVGALVILTGGLGNALVTVNLINLQGTLGAFQVETNWLPTVYVMANVSMNLLLVKFRQQFGMRAFTIYFLALYALVTFGHLFVGELASASAALSTLGIFYTMQAFTKDWRYLGLILAIGVSQLPQPMAYIFSSRLLALAEWRGLYLFELGLSLVTLGAVMALKLPPGDRFKAFRPADFLTFSLFAPGMALLCAAVSFGRVLWWTQQAWIGVALAASIVLLAAAFCVEHSRTTPLLNLRWLTDGAIVHMALAMILVRVVLSEQSVGAVGFLRLVGLNNDEMQTLFAVILAASIAAIGVLLAVVRLQRPHRLVLLQIVALVLMALGAWLDAHADNLTRPGQMLCSQAMLAFGGVLFIGPATLALIGSVLTNPSAIISFSVLFGLTQNLGGLLGASLVGTFQVVREKYHAAMLADALSSLDPLVATRLAQGAAAYGNVLADPAARAHQGVAALSAAVTREANVLAYNDVFTLIATLSALMACWILARAVWVAHVAAPSKPG